MKYLEKIELRPPVGFVLLYMQKTDYPHSGLRGKIAMITGETVYTPPPAPDVPMMMMELVNWLNRAEETHPVLVSSVTQFQFVHIL